MIRNKTAWQSYKGPNSTSRVQSHSLVSNSWLPPENVTEGSVGNLLSALNFQCSIHGLFFLLPIPIPRAFIKMLAVLDPLLSPTWAEILRAKTTDHLPHRSLQCLYSALEKGYLLARISGNGVRWPWLCVLTYVYTAQTRRTSNALNRLKELLNYKFLFLSRLMAMWKIYVKLISRNSYHLLSTY